MKKELLGVDLFIHWDETGRNANEMGSRLESLAKGGLKLKMITNRGVKVYPDGKPETFCTDHWRCRFVSAGSNPVIAYADVLELMQSVAKGGLDIVKTENLYQFDGERAYSLGQGE